MIFRQLLNQNESLPRGGQSPPDFYRQKLRDVCDEGDRLYTAKSPADAYVYVAGALIALTHCVTEDYAETDPSNGLRPIGA